MAAKDFFEERKPAALALSYAGFEVFDFGRELFLLAFPFSTGRWLRTLIVSHLNDDIEIDGWLGRKGGASRRHESQKSDEKKREQE